jgi:hypothetical protein
MVAPAGAILQDGTGFAACAFDAASSMPLPAAMTAAVFKNCFRILSDISSSSSEFIFSFVERSP